MPRSTGLLRVRERFAIVGVMMTPPGTLTVCVVCWRASASVLLLLNVTVQVPLTAIAAGQGTSMKTSPNGLHSEHSPSKTRP
jgi:hypothetical protein